MDERQTVEAAVAGDAEAFRLLFERFYPLIYSYAYRLCSNQADAEDIAQETFIKAARALPGYRPEVAFRHWLYQICTNTTRDWRRKSGRRARLEESVEQHARMDSSEPPSDRFSHAHEALAKLPEELRAAVVLVYLEDMNHAQAARILGCAESTVSWRIFRAKRKLKALFASHE